MIVVVSQAWTKDPEASARGYIEQSRAFLDFMRKHAGFHARKLIRGLDDPTHFTNLRWFDSVDAYQAMTEHADYQAQIRALSQHLDLSKYEGRSAREFMHVVLDD
jgi:hypothetical protein